MNFDYLGVNHNLVTYKSHKDKFESEFAKSDAVLLEGAPRAEGLIDAQGRFSDGVIDAYQQVYKMPKGEIKSKLERLRSTIDFFAEVERTAGEMGKDVLVFDPYSMSPDGVASREKLQMISAQLLGFKAMVLTAIPGTAATAGGYFAVKEILRKHPRRAFIIGASSAIAAGVAGSMIIGDSMEQQRTTTPASVNKSNPFSLTLMDFIDYRNAAVSCVFTNLADRGELDLKVAGVYGDAHRAQMRYYFEHPAHRDFKLSHIYPEMISAAPPRYRRFKYQRNNSWAKIEDRIIKR